MSIRYSQDFKDSLVQERRQAVILLDKKIIRDVRLPLINHFCNA